MCKQLDSCMHISICLSRIMHAHTHQLYLYTNTDKTTLRVIRRLWGGDRRDSKRVHKRIHKSITKGFTKDSQRTRKRTHKRIHKAFANGLKGCPRKMLFLHWFYKVVREKHCFYIGFTRLSATSVASTCEQKMNF